MAHEDQFTATGPAFEEAGFPRAAFSTGRLGTDSTYGVNVHGSECGVYGESLNPQSESREARTVGAGVYGKGDSYGVSGEGLLGGIGGWSARRTSSPGVIGANLVDGPGVAGLSLDAQSQFNLGAGIGIVGVSKALQL
jgi:hypothetical protein